MDQEKEKQRKRIINDIASGFIHLQADICSLLVILDDKNPDYDFYLSIRDQLFPITRKTIKRIYPDAPDLSDDLDQRDLYWQGSDGRI